MENSVNGFEEVDGDELIPATEIQNELGLGASQFYNYRGHLRITPYKRGKKSFYDHQQCELFRSLSAYIDDGEGKLIDYPRPEPSGPGAEEWEEEGKLTYPTETAPAPKTGSDTPTYITGIDPNRIKAKATALAKEQAIAQMLGSQLAENLDLLSPKDRAEIESYRSHFEAAFPKPQYSPQDITALVIPQPASGAEGEEAELVA